MSRRLIWITRSLPIAERSAAYWRAAGFDIIIEPLVQITPPKTMPEPLPEQAVILMSSQNALRFLGIYTDRRHWPVLTVGDATARMARSMGFDNVISAQGNVQDLLARVQLEYRPSDSVQFVYGSGSQVRLDLAGALKTIGYKAVRHIYYENEGVFSMPSVSPDSLDYIALYSPLAARMLGDHAKYFKKASSIAMSPNIDKALGLSFKGRRLVANDLTEKAMIQSILDKIDSGA